MPYDKLHFSKKNEKKILKKVKKQWVVASMSVLALLSGGFALEGSIVHADDQGGSDANVTSAVESKPVDNASATNANQSGASNVESANHSDSVATMSASQSNLPTASSTSTDTTNTDNDATNQSSASVDTNTSSAANSSSNSASSTNAESSSASSDAQSSSSNDVQSSSSSNAQSSSSNTQSSTKDDYITASSSNRDKSTSSDYHSVTSSASAKSTSASSSSNASSENSTTSSSASSTSGSDSSSASGTSLNGSSSASSSNVTTLNVSNDILSIDDANLSVRLATDTGSTGSQSSETAAFSNGFSAAVAAAAGGSSVATSADSEFNSGVQAFYAANAGAISAWNSLHPDDLKSANSTDTFASNNAYYANGFNAVNDAYSTYNSLNSGAGTQSGSSVYGTSASATTSNFASGSVDRSKSAVVVNSPSDSAEATSGNDVQSASSGNISLASDSAEGQSAAYNYAVDFFLSRQGAYDAESGRWNGTDKNGSFSALDATKNSNNPYVQAYNGAQAAIDDENSGGYRSVNALTGNNSVNYSYGYNDVANKVNNGYVDAQGNKTYIYFAANPVMLDSYLADSANNGHQSEIRITKDMQSTSGSSSASLTGTDTYVTVNGQNHVVDLTTMHNNPFNINLTIENFAKMYGTNVYGQINMYNSTTGSLKYKNINYEGSQLFYGSSVPNVYIDGGVNVISEGQYTSIWGSRNTDNYNQQNLEVTNLEVLPGATYNGETQDGNVIELGGNLILDAGAKMILRPGGSGGENAGSYGSSGNKGIALKGSGANVNISQGADLSIVPKDSGADAIYTAAGSNINVNGGSINIVYNQNPNDTNPTNIQGSVTVQNGGSLTTHATKGVTNYGGNLISVAGNLNVINRGNLYVYADGTNTNGDLTLFSNSGNVLINTPGNNIVFSKNGLNNDGTGTAAGTFFKNTGNIVAYSAKGSLDGKDTGSAQSMIKVLGNGNVVYYKYGQSDNQAQYTTLNNFNNSNSKFLEFTAVPTVYFSGLPQLAADSNTKSGYDVVANVKLSNVEDSNGYVYLRTTTNTADETPTGSTTMLSDPDQQTGNGSDSDYRNAYTVKVPVSAFTQNSDGSYYYKYVQTLNTTNTAPTSVTIDAQYGVTNQSATISDNNGNTQFTSTTHNPSTSAVTNNTGNATGTLADNVIVPNDSDKQVSAADSAASAAAQVANTAGSMNTGSYSLTASSASAAVG
ncbi:beta strand repeat-containing protein [Nicoliella lavandulae]|uniref:Uncharacterized protein n=1 Tax=Nicoliella lavandulae TaxID=3082954 RepID=A0ABU8SIY2_9LACO